MLLSCADKNVPSKREMKRAVSALRSAFYWAVSPEQLFDHSRRQLAVPTNGITDRQAKP